MAGANALLAGVGSGGNSTTGTLTHGSTQARQRKRLRAMETRLDRYLQSGKFIAHASAHHASTNPYQDQLTHHGSTRPDHVPSTPVAHASAHHGSAYLYQGQLTNLGSVNHIQPLANNDRVSTIHGSMTPGQYQHVMVNANAHHGSDHPKAKNRDRKDRREEGAKKKEGHP